MVQTQQFDCREDHTAMLGSTVAALVQVLCLAMTHKFLCAGMHVHIKRFYETYKLLKHIHTDTVVLLVGIDTYSQGINCKRALLM